MSDKLINELYKYIFYGVNYNTNILIIIVLLEKI